jgi:hypothetical protein
MRCLLRAISHFRTVRSKDVIIIKGRKQKKG